MNTTFIKPYRQQIATPSKNCVGISWGVTSSCTGVIWSQVPATQQETSGISTLLVSDVGSWLSKDPIGISGGLNQYVFCGNNGINFIDPLGLVPFTNDSDKSIPYKPEKEEFQPPRVALPGETVDADGVYTPNSAGASMVVKFPDNSSAYLDDCGKLTVQPENWKFRLGKPFWGLDQHFKLPFVDGKFNPKKLSPEDLSKPEFRNWPDPYTGRNWPGKQWK